MTETKTAAVETAEKKEVTVSWHKMTDGSLTNTPCSYISDSIPISEEYGEGRNFFQEVSPNRAYYFTRCLLIFLEVVFSNSVERSSRAFICLKLGRRRLICMICL